MKKYERIELELSFPDSVDVITTSSEVVTDAITMPWQTKTYPVSNNFNLTE